MTYLATAFSESCIVMGSDGRAHYFDDWKENEKVVGKIITSYWDGNQKTFLVKRRIGISTQGLLFWGDERQILSLLIKNFEGTVGERSSLLEVGRKLLQWFRGTKRRGSHEYEVMHLIVAGFENRTPHVFYINTFGDGSIENVCPKRMKSGVINGDGETAEILNPAAGKESLIRFVRNEILRAHYLKPFDVGDKLDTLVIPQYGAPYWHQRQKRHHRYPTYDRYMEALHRGSIRGEKLPRPIKLRYQVTKRYG